MLGRAGSARPPDVSVQRSLGWFRPRGRALVFLSLLVPSALSFFHFMAEWCVHPPLVQRRVPSCPVWPLGILSTRTTECTPRHHAASVVMVASEIVHALLYFSVASVLGLLSSVCCRHPTYLIPHPLYLFSRLMSTFDGVHSKLSYNHRPLPRGCRRLLLLLVPTGCPCCRQAGGAAVGTLSPRLWHTLSLVATPNALPYIHGGVCLPRSG